MSNFVSVKRRRDCLLIYGNNHIAIKSKKAQLKQLPSCGGKGSQEELDSFKNISYQLTKAEFTKLRVRDSLRKREMATSYIYRELK